MSLNFADFEIASTANTRRPGTYAKRGQNFKHLRFRKFIADKGKENEREETLFQLSNEMFEETTLNRSDRAGLQIISPDGNTICLAVVDRDNGTVLKHSDKAQARSWEKGDKFKATKLEEALAAKGIIDNTVVGNSQKLELTKVGENVTLKGGVLAYAIYQISKDESVEAETSEEVAGVPTEIHSDDMNGFPQGDAFVSDEDDF